MAQSVSGDLAEKRLDKIKPLAMFRGKDKMEPIWSWLEVLMSFFRYFCGVIVQDNFYYPVDKKQIV